MIKCRVSKVKDNLKQIARNRGPTLLGLLHNCIEPTCGASEGDFCGIKVLQGRGRNASP
jgi:hypothetical protein